MKKIHLAVAFLFSLNTAFTQWTKINAIPTNDIVALAVHNNIIYAASDANAIYKSSDGGVAWSRITVSKGPIDITSLIFYNDKIYVGTFNFGVFFSSDNGNTWQNNGSVPKWISQFTIRDNVLYASTLGNGVAVMNPNTNNWSFINASLPDYSINVQSIIGSPNFLLVAAGSNGTFYRYDFNNSIFREEYYDGVLHPGLQISKLINDADTVFAVNFNRIIKSSNAGINWTNDKSGTHDGFYRTIYAGVDNYYTLTDMAPEGTWIQQRNKHAVTGTTWATNEEFLPTGFSYDIIEFDNKLFLGKADGLYVKNLVTVNDHPLPVHFSLFNTSCDGNKVLLNWRTEQEQNSSSFDIETSKDGVNWTVIGNLPAAGNSSIQNSYSFTVNDPLQNNFYRVGQYGMDGSVQYTTVLRSSCIIIINDLFKVWPNPVSGNITIHINAHDQSRVGIKIFDSKGMLVRSVEATVSQGHNQLNIDMQNLANGVYYLSASWNNDPFQKTIQVVKQ